MLLTLLTVAHVLLTLLTVAHVLLTLLTVAHILLTLLTVAHVLLTLLTVAHVLLTLLTVGHVLLTLLTVAHVLLTLLTVAHILLTLLTVVHVLLNSLTVSHVLLALLTVAHVLSFSRVRHQGGFHHHLHRPGDRFLHSHLSPRREVQRSVDVSPDPTPQLVHETAKPPDCIKKPTNQLFKLAQYDAGAVVRLIMLVKGMYGDFHWLIRWHADKSVEVVNICARRRY